MQSLLQGASTLSSQTSSSSSHENISVEETKHSLPSFYYESKLLQSPQRLPIKKRPFYAVIDSLHNSNDVSMGSCDPPPTKLRRLVASCWNDICARSSDNTMQEFHECFTPKPNWKEITKHPPSSGSYLYNETYAEEYPSVGTAARQTSVGTASPSHMREGIRNYNHAAVSHALSHEVTEEAYSMATYSSPVNFDTQPEELSFASESGNDMNKKPAAIAMVDYGKTVHVTSNGNELDDESGALVPLGPSRRTTAAHEALFSMSPKPMSLDSTDLLRVPTKATTIQKSSHMKTTPTLEELSIPLTKLSRKDNSLRLGHDSMSYSTDDTDQPKRRLPYLDVAMLPSQALNLLSDTDDEEELLLMTDTLTSPATNAVGPQRSTHSSNVLPSVTPSPNIMQQEQLKVVHQKNLISSIHKKHPSLMNIKSLFRPKALKAPLSSSKTEDINESEFLNRIGNLFYSHDSATNPETAPSTQNVGNNRRCAAFQPVMKRDNYQKLLDIHDIISDLKTASRQLPPNVIATPIRHIPKPKIKSPFKPIDLKEHDHSSHQVIYSDRAGASMNSLGLRPLSRFSPLPKLATKSYSHHASRDQMAMMRTPTPREEKDPMEWEHPLNQAAESTMMMSGIASPPRHDIHFFLNAPTKIELPVPSEVVVVPITCMSMKHLKSDTKSMKSSPSKTNHQPFTKTSSTSNTVTPKVTTSIRQIYATQVKTASVVPNRMIGNELPHSTKAGPFGPSTTVHARTNRTAYVPPAPMGGSEWDGMVMTMAATSSIRSNNKLQSLQHQVASAFAPGQRGYDKYQYSHGYNTPMGGGSKNPIYRTTTASSTSGQPLAAATTTLINDKLMRRGNENNCMSSSSCSSNDSRSSSLSNSTFSGSIKKKKRPNEYDRQEA